MQIFSLYDIQERLILDNFLEEPVEEPIKIEG